MTPAAFIAKWRPVELKERSAAHTHFIDLCRVLGFEDPVAADPTGDWFTFEKGASKTTGGDGWADVWRKGHFGWEYKGKHKDLETAYRQLLNYAVALENPPLLITCDTDRIVIRTNLTNTVQETHTLLLDDLLDGAKRDVLRAAFADPERLRPSKSRDALTAEAASKFSTLALRLRERGHDAQTVAHFVNRLVFCMFAEDVGLLPDKLFQKMLEASRAAPSDFAAHAATLFAAMKDGGARRLHPRRLVQWRPLRRRHRPAGGPRRPRPASRSRPPRLVPDRPLDPRHPLRARPRPRQAQPARRPLHRPRQDHEDRRSGHRRAPSRRMDRGAVEDREAHRVGAEADRREAAARRRTRRAHPGAHHRRAASPRLPRPPQGRSASSTPPAAPATSSTSACGR